MLESTDLCFILTALQCDLSQKQQSLSLSPHTPPDRDALGSSDVLIAVVLKPPITRRRRDRENEMFPDTNYRPIQTVT